MATTESLNNKLGLYSLVKCFFSKYLLLNTFLIFAFQQNIMTAVILITCQEGLSLTLWVFLCQRKSVYILHNKYDGVRVGTNQHLKGLPVGEMSVRGREEFVGGGGAGFLPLRPIRWYVALRILCLNEEWCLSFWVSECLLGPSPILLIISVVFWL